MACSETWRWGDPLALEHPARQQPHSAVPTAAVHADNAAKSTQRIHLPCVRNEASASIDVIIAGERRSRPTLKNAVTLCHCMHKCHSYFSASTDLHERLPVYHDNHHRDRFGVLHTAVLTLCPALQRFFVCLPPSGMMSHHPRGPASPPVRARFRIQTRLPVTGPTVFNPDVPQKFNQPP